MSMLAATRSRSPRLGYHDVAARYGISVRTVIRYWQDRVMGFPEGKKVFARRTWTLTELEAWEAESGAVPVEQPSQGRPAVQAG